MQYTTAAVALLASAANAMPSIHARHDIFHGAGAINTRAVAARGTNGTNSTATPAGGFQSVVYWGQSQNKPLADVCQENVDTVVMAFVNKYGNETKNGEPSANPGWLCQTDSTEAWAKNACADLGKNVTACQAAGKKVMMSVGGWIDYSSMKAGDGKKLGEGLWDQYAVKGDKNVLGGATLDGFDFDIEHDNDGNKLAHYVEAAEALRAKGDTLISGAPMCVPAAQNVMSEMMEKVKFDELYFQFYNNKPCGVNDEAGATAAWDGWVKTLSGGASKSAKMFLGFIGDTGAGMAEYYLDEAKTISIVDKLKTHKQFAGVMVWDAGYAMNNTQPAGNYLDSLAKAIGKK